MKQNTQKMPNRMPPFVLHITIKANYGNTPFPGDECMRMHVQDHLTMMASAISLCEAQLYTISW